MPVLTKAQYLAKAPHLRDWPLTPLLKAAIAELGQAEVSGPRSNPRIIEYRRMAGIDIGGDDSVVPWCAIFINAMLAQAGVATSGNAMARSFVSSKHFERLEAPIVGCITVISSSRGPSSGHVFLYVGDQNGLFFLGLGGNQSDAVTIDAWHKSKLVGHFWPRGVPRPAAPFDKPVRLARPLLPHERGARDA